MYKSIRVHKSSAKVSWECKLVRVYRCWAKLSWG